VLIVRLENVPVLDASGAAAIGELVSRAGAAGTRVIVCTSRPDVIAMLGRARIDDRHGLLARTATYADAIARARMG
jgi:SulP family sulfate permease